MSAETIHVISYSKDKAKAEIVVKRGKTSETRHVMRSGAFYVWQRTHPSGEVEFARYTL